MLGAPAVKAVIEQKQSQLKQGPVVPQSTIRFGRQRKDDCKGPIDLLLVEEARW